MTTIPSLCALADASVQRHVRRTVRARLGGRYGIDSRSARLSGGDVLRVVVDAPASTHSRETGALLIAAAGLSLHAIVHEELHGCSRREHPYEGVGLAIEEAATEIVAYDAVEGRLPWIHDGLYAAGGAYGAYVAALCDAWRRITGASLAGLVAAIAATRRVGAPVLPTSWEHAAAIGGARFADLLHAVESPLRGARNQCPSREARLAWLGGP